MIQNIDFRVNYTGYAAVLGEENAQPEYNIVILRFCLLWQRLIKMTRFQMVSLGFETTLQKNETIPEKSETMR